MSDKDVHLEMIKCDLLNEWRFLLLFLYELADVLPNIRAFAFSSTLGEVTEVFRKEGPFGHARLAVSPDDEWLLYAEAPSATSELMLVENFR